VGEQSVVPPGQPQAPAQPVADATAAPAPAATSVPSGSATPPSSDAVPIAPATQDLGEIPLDDPTIATASGNRPGQTGNDGSGHEPAVAAGPAYAPTPEHAQVSVPVAGPAPAAPVPARDDRGPDVEIRLDPVELALCADLMRVTGMAYEQVTGRLASLSLRPDLDERLRDLRLELTLLSQELEEEARVLDLRREAAEARLR
jgi:hypothetical protein